MSSANNSNFTKERKVFTWSKFLTGVEKKPDGKLIYKERGNFLRFHKQKYKFYQIDNSTYRKLNIFAVVEITIIVFLFIYLKSTTSPNSIPELCLIFASGVLLDSILIFLRTQLVKMQKGIHYEK